MRVVLVSNFLNHFTFPLCESLASSVDDFRFVATAKPSQMAFRQELSAEYVLHVSGEKDVAKALQFVSEADVAIFGDGGWAFMEERMYHNKLSFLFSERLFKRGTWRRFIPTTWYRLYRRFLRYKKRELYVLCASAYLPYDLSLLGFPAEKCFRWGYFPFVKKYGDIDGLFAAKHKMHFIWVGRLIPLKHPELAISLVDELVKSGYDVHLDIVGKGPMEGLLNEKIQSCGLSGKVSLLGGKTLDEVRGYMEQSTFFLFTSDFNEGWGAVVNEAMNSGCVVLGSHAAGSVPFLIRHKMNGMLFKSEDVNSLFNAAVSLLQSPEKCEQLRRQAYQDIQEMWNASQATERLLELCRHLLEHQPSPYSIGPCSQAECLANDWFTE